MKLDKIFVLCFCIFGFWDGAQNTPFSQKITNQILRLNYAQRTCAKRKQEIVLYTITFNSTSIATTLFSLLNVLSFHDQSR